MLTILPQADEAIVDLLQQNIIGTPGLSMLYQHQTMVDKLQEIAQDNHYFAALRRKNTVVGTACFCERQVQLQGQRVPAFYIRYFTFNARFRRKDSNVTKPWLAGNSQIKAEIQRLLDGEVLAPANALFYAYVDPRNQRSVNICQALGFERVASFESFVFSRLSPKTTQGVQKITFSKANQSHVFAQMYASMPFFFDNYLRQGMYAIYEGNQLVAAAHAQPEHWRVLSLPGKSGKFLLNTLPRLPWVNRLFAKQYHFARIDTLFCLPNYEQKLEQLLEHILADLGVYSAVLPIAERHPIRPALAQINLGLLAKMSQRSKIDLIVKNALPSSFESGFYVSSFDIT